ncbi:TPA: elongation factor 4 [bacterium]|nr:elongation factor 4 [bacterium]
MENIRNFSIIAHIDHGKTTLADRLLETTRTIEPSKMQEQVLDNMPLERERGITIKAHPIRMVYNFNGKEYVLNLIDTPGHVDFSYEVTRSLAAVEGVLLVIDGSQGVEAQTVAHGWLAVSQNKKIISIINKIDLDNIDLSSVLSQIKTITDDEPILASAKEGIGIYEIFEKIIKDIPGPQGDIEKPTKALIFDSYFDPYKGVVLYVRVFDGTIREDDTIILMSNNASYQVIELGTLRMGLVKKRELKAGEVGYICAGIRRLSDASVGDTITTKENIAKEALPGYRKLKPMVFASIYPAGQTSFEELSSSIEKYSLNDSGFVFKKETSPALGFGFRCGFLGILHMEIVQERLEREYGISIIVSSPSIPYRVYLNTGKVLEIENPSDFPDITCIAKSEEPYINATIVVPEEYLSNVLNLVKEKRGIKKEIKYIEGTQRLILNYEIPLSEMIVDFHDRLKSVSCGFASFDYDLSDYKEIDLVKLDILLAGEVVEPLASLIRKEDAYSKAKKLVIRLKEIIPRQQFAVTVQAAIGKNVIAKEIIPSFRKDVTAKCYGGDVTRKRKLLERQKEGKRRMKMIGKLNLPQEAFQAVLRA